MVWFCAIFLAALSEENPRFNQLKISTLLVKNPEATGNFRLSYVRCFPLLAKNGNCSFLVTSKTQLILKKKILYSNL